MTAGGQYTELYNISGRAGGCSCKLMQGSDGILYGVAEGGANGIGTIFALNVGLPKPAPQALSFSPSQGAVGARVRIWGYNLLSSSVQFNGAGRREGGAQRSQLRVRDRPRRRHQRAGHGDHAGRDEHDECRIHGEVKDAELTNRTCNS